MRKISNYNFSPFVLLCSLMLFSSALAQAQTDTTQKVNQQPAVFSLNGVYYPYDEPIVEALSGPRNLLGISPQALVLSGIDLSYSRISPNWHIKFGGAFYTNEESEIFSFTDFTPISSNEARNFNYTGNFNAFRLEISPRKVFKLKSNSRIYMDAGIFLNYRQFNTEVVQTNSFNGVATGIRNFSQSASSLMLGPVIGVNKFFGDVWYFSADIGVGMVTEIENPLPTEMTIGIFPLQRGMNIKSSFTIGIFL